MCVVLSSASRPPRGGVVMPVVVVGLVALVACLGLFALAAHTRSQLRSLKSEVGGPYRRYDFKSPAEATAFARTTGSLRRRAGAYTGGAILTGLIAVAVVIAQVARFGA